MNVIGDKNLFAIGYEFFDDERVTELSLYIHGENILEFSSDGELFTTKWDLDELALWLREFIENMEDDPYPVSCDGEFAAMKDVEAREFDSDDDDEVDAYYSKLYEWDYRHRWHHASSGAVLADVYFQKSGDFVEISWNNEDADENVVFTYSLGGARIDLDMFRSTVDGFLKAYATHWFR